MHAGAASMPRLNLDDAAVFFTIKHVYPCNTMQTHQFQTEVRQLLDIVIHAFYSDREVFVRELVSNASDALEKLRLKQLTEAAVYEPERELRISITNPDISGAVIVKGKMSDLAPGMSVTAIEHRKN